MSFKFVIALLLLVFSFHFSNAQAFVQRTGAAIDITINPKDGKAYIVDQYNNIAKYDSKKKKFVPFAAQTSVVKEVAFDSKGKNYIVSKNDRVCERKNNSWIPLGPGKYHSLTIDENNHPWVISKTGHRLNQYYLGTWRAVPQLPGKNCSHVAARNDNYCYIINKNNKTISSFGVSVWSSMPGKAIDITIDLKTNEVYIIDDSNKILKWRKDRRQWEALNNTRRDFKKLAVYDGTIWAITHNKDIYFYDSKVISNNSIRLTKAPATTTRGSVTKVSKTKTFNSSSKISKVSGKKNSKELAGTYRFEITRILTHSPEQNKLKTPIDIYGTMGIYLNGKKGNKSVKIAPLNGKKNRMVDFPKNNPQKIDSKYWKRPRVIEVDIDGQKREYLYLGEHKVEIIREFNVLNDLANEDLTFDFQTNMSQKLLIGDLNFEWKRKKINVEDIDFGKEQFFLIKGGSYPGTYLYVGYTITKQ